MEIPDNLCSFDFIEAWERFKAHFDAVNEGYWLQHFSRAGIEAALKEIEFEIKNLDRGNLPFKDLNSIPKSRNSRTT